MTITELAVAAGTADRIIQTFVNEGFIAPCLFHAHGVNLHDDCAIVALAWRTLYLEVETEIPPATAEWFLSLFPPTELAARKAA